MPNLYAASSIQRQFWLLWRAAPSGSAYNIGSRFHLRGPLQEQALLLALHDLVARHPVLRTTFEEKDGELWAQVHDQLTPDIAQVNAAMSEEELRSFFAQPFHLGQGPLMRARLAPAPEGGHLLALVLHHVTCDLRSKELLGKDLAALYAERTGGTPAASPAEDYASLASHDRAWATSDRAKAALDYFAEHLSPLPGLLELPSLGVRRKSQAVLGACMPFPIVGELAARLRSQASARSQKPFLLLLANWALLLARYSHLDRIAIGVPLTNRRLPGRAEAVGCFVNILPLAIDVAGRSFDEIVTQVRGHMLGHHRQQEISLTAVVDRLRLPRDPSRNPVFQAGFTFEPPMALPLPGIEVTSTKVHAGGTQLDVFMTLWESDAGFEGQVEYASELFARETIARLVQNYLQQLDSALKQGTLSAGELSALAPEERTLALRGFNQTEVTWPLLKPLPHLFLDQVERTPEAVALSMGPLTMSYRELRERALQVAATLGEQGCGPGDRIGLFMDRSFELVVCLLGISLAGASYVPMDTDLPAQRLENMMEDAAPKLVLGHGATVSRWPAGASPLVLVEHLPTLPRERLRLVQVDLGDAIYVIFTSGSTGRPKGAINTHLGVANRVLWMQDRYRLGADDVVLQKTPYGFDVSTWEFFWPLITGARLEIAPPGAHQDPFTLARVIQNARVTVVHFVPSMLQAFLDHPDAAGCTSLRAIMASGEALSCQLVQRCRKVLPTPLHNLYGPTEAAVDVTAWECDQDLARDPVPIGRPIANTSMYVLDERRHPVPIGVAGELFIGGLQVGVGYVNRPEQTTERFLPDPFSARPGARMYRTGDRGRWDSDGQLVYLGRLDNQVKIHGRRIELSEIESVLEGCEGVQQSVVIAHPPGEPNARLVAYVAGAQHPGSADALRSQARKALPAYMVPEQFVFLERLPLKPNGKVDRKALPAPQFQAPAVRPPEDDVEAWLVETWQRLLRTAAVGRDINVFEAGGNSVMIASLVGLVKQRFGLDIPLVRFFEHPTVSELAAHIKALMTGPSEAMPNELAAAQQRADMRKRVAAPRPRRPS